MTICQSRIRRKSHIIPGPCSSDTPDSIKEAILLSSTVKKILKFAESHVSWQHCCVHFPDFWIEVDQFWIALDGPLDEWIGSSSGWATVEPTWIALLYSIMGIAVHQMDESDANRCGLSEGNFNSRLSGGYFADCDVEDRLVLPNALISAAEDALHHGSFLSSPTVWTVQSIAILTLCGHNVCESDLLSSFLAIGIKMAQTLGLHNLGGTTKGIETSQMSGWSVSNGYNREHVIEVELGKRIWWALVQEDWFAIPFRGLWSE